MLGHKRMPSREGGVEVVVEELSTRMAALGHEVTVYSRSGCTTPKLDETTRDVRKGEYVYKGVRVKQVPTIDIRGIAALTSSYAAMHAAVNDNPDVIHVHAEGPCAAIGIAKRKGIRTVATIHGLDWQRAKWGRIASAYIKHGEKVAAADADALIVLSDSMKHYFAETYSCKSVFIPNGIEIKAPRIADFIKRKWSLTCESYVLFLGRIVPEKGVHYLIEAYKQLETDKRLVIAGSGLDSAAYETEVHVMAEEDPRILFTGFVDGQMLEELYSNAYAFILPSDIEGMPMSLLEAMAYGRCCITSNIPECADVLGDTGLTFTRGDTNALREVLAVALSNPARVNALGAAAKERVAGNYDWNNVVEQTLEVYRGAFV